ncbi:hypothetical protein [Frankia sp. Cas4]|uniref:hypothetical protein n=1 Tax=Frankia sp. Cas4 TaxID=3073927 RepID=UPI002AD39500|nr:hypothetical protein [Frankia sp. Cas4]
MSIRTGSGIEARWERRRTRYAARRAAAATPADRLMAAVDYLRGALADVPAGRARRAAADAAEHLTALADQLAREVTSR